MKEYFKLKEMECPCCHEVKFDEKFYEMLNKAREIAGIPFIINSGYRCQKHNKEVGGTDGSAHTKGLACDIKCSSSQSRYKIVNSLLKAGFNRIGIGANFIHADCDNTLPECVIWTY